MTINITQFHKDNVFNINKLLCITESIAIKMDKK